jgi:transcription elongation factor Elf1
MINGKRKRRMERISEAKEEIPSFLKCPYCGSSNLKFLYSLELYREKTLFCLDCFRNFIVKERLENDNKPRKA